MFTGIIEEIGKVKSIVRAGNTLRLSIAARVVTSDVKLGDSIAVNGVCLTVTNFDKGSFSADVMPVTFYATNLSGLSINSPVNLERAMAANGRFGGHMVSGHIDGVAKIIAVKNDENAVIYTLELPDTLESFCVVKGSIAIDGTSLTIADIEANKISVSLIPHTYKHSVLGIKKSGELVNIECDIMAKQHAKLAGYNVMPKNHKADNSSGITESYLAEHGFI